VTSLIDDVISDVIDGTGSITTNPNHNGKPNPNVDVDYQN